MTHSPKLDRATPVLRSGDYATARQFWTGGLGFALREEGGDPPRFGIFRRDGATVFVDGWHGPEAEEGPAWRAYFHTDDVDALAAEVQAQGVTLLSGPEDKVYGMREITLRDPDGNLLCFGQDVPSAAP